MGLFSGIRNYFQGKRNAAIVQRIANMLNQGYSLSCINRSLYDIPEVRTAINWIAEKVGLVPFNHIRSNAKGDIKQLNDQIAYILNTRPNPYQTPSVFKAHMTTVCFLNNNSYAYPDWDERTGNLNAIYPLPYTQHQLSTGPDGKLIITFQGLNGPIWAHYEDILHFQRFPTGKGGAPKQATRSYTDVVGAMQEQAVKDAETSGRVQALLKTNLPLNTEDMGKKLEEFKTTFMTAENTTGFGMIGGQYSVEKVDIKQNTLNIELMNTLVAAICNYFGVSDKVVKGTAMELEISQSVCNGVKPFIRQMEEEFTYKLFSRGEIDKYNKISAELIELEITTLSAKTTFYKEMLWATAISRNEVRKRMGLPRGPDELDKFPNNKNFDSVPMMPGTGGGENSGENSAA